MTADTKKFKGTVFSVSSETISIVDDFNNIAKLAARGYIDNFEPYQMPYHPEGGLLSAFAQEVFVYRDLISSQSEKYEKNPIKLSAGLELSFLLGLEMATAASRSRANNLALTTLSYFAKKLQILYLALSFMRNLKSLIFHKVKKCGDKNIDQKLLIQIETSAQHHLDSIEDFINLSRNNHIHHVIFHTPSINLKVALDDERKLADSYPYFLSILCFYTAKNYLKNYLLSLKIRYQFKVILKSRCYEKPRQKILEIMCLQYFNRYLPNYLLLNQSLGNLTFSKHIKYARIWGTGSSHTSGNLLRNHLHTEVNEFYLPVGPVLPTQYLKDLSHYEHFFCMLPTERDLLISQCGLCADKSSLLKHNSKIEFNGEPYQKSLGPDYVIGFDFGFFAPGYNNPLDQYSLATDLIDLVSNNSSLTLIIRPHPYSNMKSFNKFMRQHRNNINVRFSLPNERFSEFLGNVDIYCGRYSTSLLDAIKQGVICFSVIYDDVHRFGLFKDYVETVDSFYKLRERILDITSSSNIFQRERDLIIDNQSAILHTQSDFQIIDLIKKIKAS